MGLATAGDAPGCHAVHPPLRLGRGASGGEACSRNARRGGWPGVGRAAVEAVNTSAVVLATVAAGPAHGPGPQAARRRRAALRAAGGGGARLVLGRAGARDRTSTPTYLRASRRITALSQWSR